MSRFVCSIPGLPRGKVRHRSSIPWSWVFSWISKGKTGKRPIPAIYSDPEYDSWEDSLADTLSAAWGASGALTPLDEACSLLLVLRFPRPISRTRKTIANEPYPHISTPDADNVSKAVQDAMQKGGLVVNDSRIFDLRVVKWVCGDGEEPGIEVVLRWGAGVTLLR